MADDGWEEKKEDIEEGVHDFPENAAHWTGEKVRNSPSSIIEMQCILIQNDRSAKPNKSPTTSKKAGTASGTRLRTAGTTPWKISRMPPRTSPNGQARRSGLWNRLVTISGMRMMRVKLRDGVMMTSDCVHELMNLVYKCEV